jgi:hypothetical protein
MLLAIGLAVFLCASMGQPAPVQSDGISTMSGLVVAAEPQGSSESRQHWHPLRQTSAAVTESVWKSAPVHAALAASRSARTIDTAVADGGAHSPTRSAPPYLRHTPLLI